MAETKEAQFMDKVMKISGGLVVVTDKKSVIIPTNVGQTKEYCLESFRRDYSSQETDAIHRAEVFLSKAEIAVKKHKGRLGFLNRCLPESAEILIFNLRPRRRSEGFFADRVFINYEKFKEEGSKFPSFFSKKPRK